MAKTTTRLPEVDAAGGRIALRIDADARAVLAAPPDLSEWTGLERALSA